MNLSQATQTSALYFERLLERNGVTYDPQYLP
jgi:hypothetical protein